MISYLKHNIFYLYSIHTNEVLASLFFGPMTSFLLFPNATKLTLVNEEYFSQEVRNNVSPLPGP